MEGAGGMKYGTGCNLEVSVYIEALEALGFEVLADDGDHIVRPYNWDSEHDLPKHAGPIIARRPNRGMADVSESGMFPTPRKWSYVAPTLPEVWAQVVDEMTDTERAEAVEAINERVSVLLARMQSMTTLLGYVYHADV